MFRSDPARNGGACRGERREKRRPHTGPRLILYVEGPADRGILRGWAYRQLPSEFRSIFDSSVILGGRRPARALQHFRDAGGAASGARALCVLDRDAGDLPEALPGDGEPGLEIFTWSLRHIESYLLVPEALKRALGRADPRGQLVRLLREHLPNDGDEEAWRAVDAKRLLGPGGLLPRTLGRPIDLARVARMTLDAELHPDVHTLFGRMRHALRDLEGER